MISSVLKDLLLHLDKGIAELLSSLRRSLAASNIMFPSCSIGFRSVCGPGGGVRSFIHQEVSAYSSCMSSGIVMHRWKPTAPVQCLTLDLALHSLPMPNSVTGNMTFSRSCTSRYQCCWWVRDLWPCPALFCALGSALGDTANLTMRNWTTCATSVGSRYLLVVRSEKMWSV